MLRYWGVHEKQYVMSHKHHSVSDHQPPECLLNSLFELTSKKHQSHTLLALCEGNPPVTGGFPSQRGSNARSISMWHDDVIKWKHFPRYWPFVRGIHRSPVNSLHKGQWRGALIFFSLICIWINGWVNNREAGDLRQYCAHYDVIVMIIYHAWAGICSAVIPSMCGGGGITALWKINTGAHAKY